jgi:hypothetical protein
MLAVVVRSVVVARCQVGVSSRGSRPTPPRLAVAKQEPCISTVNRASACQFADDAVLANALIPIARLVERIARVQTSLSRWQFTDAGRAALA